MCSSIHTIVISTVIRGVCVMSQSESSPDSSDPLRCRLRPCLLFRFRYGGRGGVECLCEGRERERETNQRELLTLIAQSDGKCRGVYIPDWF